VTESDEKSPTGIIKRVSNNIMNVSSQVKDQLKETLSSARSSAKKPILNSNPLTIVAETALEHLPSTSNQADHFLGAVEVAEEDEDNYRDSLFGKSKLEAASEGFNSTSFYRKD